MSGKKEGFKPWIGTTFLIGFGFFTMGMMDPLYDSYVPDFLRVYIKSMTAVGFIMTLDNIFALFMIPVVSVLSDRTHTRIGRRMPWILATLPASAALFALIPHAATAGVVALVLVLLFLNVFKQSARGPVVALMPDIIPSDFRSEANGIINTMSGIAAIIGTVVLARFMDLDTVLPVFGPTKNRLPFALAAIFVVVAVIILFLKVREPKASTEKTETPPILSTLKDIAGHEDKSALFILVSIVLWFLGHQGVVPFLGLYAMDVLHLSKGTAPLASGVVGIAYALFAVPSGFLAHRVGRRRVIRTSLVALSAIGFLLAAFTFLLPEDAKGNPLIPVMFFGLMFLYGACWGSLNTNSFPMLWQMASRGTMGVYTGIYYTASQTAAILSPFITGFLLDLFKSEAVKAAETAAAGTGTVIPLNSGAYATVFVFCAACMAAAFLTMSRVRKGEPAKAA